MDLYEAKAVLEDEANLWMLIAHPEILEAIQTYVDIVGDKEFCAVCGEQVRAENDYNCCGFKRYVK